VVHAVLRTALTSATREEITSRNEAMLVHTPTVVSHVARALSVPGLRQAELLGLRWVDLDLDLATGRLEVLHSLPRVEGRLRLVRPKTPASRRTLPLPAAVVTALVEHRTRQDAERRASGGRWIETGAPLSPDAVRRSWIRIRQAVEGPVRVHDLRRTCLTLLLEQRTGALDRLGAQFTAGTGFGALKDGTDVRG
jgi:integrase